MSNVGSEKYSVQNLLINYVCESQEWYGVKSNQEKFLNLGWEYVSTNLNSAIESIERGCFFV